MNELLTEDEKLLQRILSDQSGLPASQPQFYADAETLKHSSGYYTFMNALQEKSELWMENCQPCQRSMKRMMLKPDTRIEAIPESDIGMSPTESYWTNSYRQYRNDPKSLNLNPSGEFWFCDGCGGVWTSCLGFWFKVKVNGEERLYIDRIKLTQDKLREVQHQQNQEPVVIDPGIKPSEDSTCCPNCHVWRTVEPYKSMPEDDLNRTHHVCPKCRCGEIYNPSL